MSTNEGAECVLLRPSPQPGESSSTLSRGVGQGALLRLKPGVFVERDAWEHAPLWIKHRAAAAAVALSAPSAVLCRETALAIYGVPLLRVPREVQLRTLSRGMVGTSRIAVPSTGTAVRFPVRRIDPPVPRGFTASDAREAHRVGKGAVSPVQAEVPGVLLSDGCRPMVAVEPLPFVLIDTLPRMSFESAVVALDAALAGRYGYRLMVRHRHLKAVEEWLWSSSAQSSWHSVLSFSDPRSESPGESRSRVIIDQLGFAAPVLQRVVALTGGRRRRLDFDWHDDGVIGEFDGELKYQAEGTGVLQSGASAYWEEKWREEEIEELTGKRFVRWRWADLDDPRRLERKLLLKGVSKR